ncbi:uncharacterized protein LAESUDRAFT_715700 [Laetiporus sulphureus 93-53]|uniref:Uncharacterized protein n=1 Tax=Laetiporus sulphureus 93-53 TaxID=1314785 RepID=A0A165D4N9_9APHY|nr:uncharacterized protein LAESUDRAFT_715700 [Laetiporus sulphureus 93-53]KZT04145.1 hypothetical protein LAESUDRAFT_715700 [Laetiporus sulphureus 93-53]
MEAGLVPLIDDPMAIAVLVSITNRGEFDFICPRSLTGDLRDVSLALHHDDGHQLTVNYISSRPFRVSNLYNGSFDDEPSTFEDQFNNRAGHNRKSHTCRGYRRKPTNVLLQVVRFWTSLGCGMRRPRIQNVEVLSVQAARLLWPIFGDDVRTLSAKVRSEQTVRFKGA